MFVSTICFHFHFSGYDNSTLLVSQTNERRGSPLDLFMFFCWVSQMSEILLELCYNSSGKQVHIYNNMY